MYQGGFMAADDLRKDRSARVFDPLAELAGVAAFQVDGDRNLVGWSAGVAELTGYGADEVLGMPCVVALRCPECMTGCGVFEHGQVHQIPLKLRRKDGEPVHVRKSGRTLTDAEGRIVGAVEILRAVTADERTTGPMDQLLGALGRDWLLADADCRVTDASETIEVARGVPLADLLGVELFGPQSPFRAAIDAGERREGWHAVLQRGGAPAEAVSISASRVPGPKPGTSGIFVLIRPDVGD